MAAPLPAAADDRSSPAPEQQQQQQSEQVPGPSAAPQAAQPEAAKSPVPLTPEELEQQAAAKLLEVRCPVCAWLVPAPPEETKGWIMLETACLCAMVVSCHRISASVVALSLHRLTCTPPGSQLLVSLSSHRHAAAFPVLPPLQEEEARRKARRKTKGRIRELEELRAELAEKVGGCCCTRT